uniref:Orf130 n=1 Tax=Amoebidium parasiticum TaxID=4881 RepID=Q8M0D1_AMOPA|nr:Orf130 [Amoebidium parasiticum]
MVLLEAHLSVLWELTAAVLWPLVSSLCFWGFITRFLSLTFSFWELTAAGLWPLVPSLFLFSASLHLQRSSAASLHFHLIHLIHLCISTHRCQSVRSRAHSFYSLFFHSYLYDASLYCCRSVHSFHSLVIG